MEPVRRIYSTIKCIAEMDTFSNSGPHKVPYVLSRSQYGTFSGKTHIKTIFSFWTGTGSVSLVTHSAALRSHILQLFHDKQYSWKPPEGEVQRSENEEDREWVPFFLSNDQETVQKHSNATGAVRWCTI
jgi:hypothetical protein